MAKPERQQQVLELLKELRGIEPLKELFWRELNYQRVNQPLSRRGWTESAAQALAEDPVLFAGGGENGDFHVIYGRLASDRLLLGAERPVVTRLLREHPYALFVFSNKAQDRWHFLNVKYADTPEKRRLFRRITVHAGEGQRTASERLALLDLASFERDMFGLSALEIQQRHDEAFDVEKVTKDFYTEIANWYFWARDCRQVVFPKDVQTKEDRALFLIRLLTRLIFCWFLREKRNPVTGEGLLPDVLFEPRGIAGLLKDASPDACTYYPAILQNLFFATLNTEMDKPGEPPNRRFIEEGDGQRSNDHMIHTLWRNQRLLRDPDALAKLLREVPFLNGGLFECLDDRVQRGKSNFTDEIRIDGFSNDPKKQPKLPNFLFFGADQVADLSGAYGDAGRRRETVRPLLSILSRYNFTLTENTPLEQEVALDPELLGHVFENLLAAYNPETGTIARKATGSFYTPRVVVDWMVDQALLAHLEKALNKPNDPRLRRLLSWEDTGHDFTPKEVERLIDAIDHLKVLDPACGSGAFPMGMLQKLVHVLRKLDPENKGWRRRQEAALDTFESAPARDEARQAIERAFARDNDDYGRKLYLIENCLYGVDIQPIACQIAKLRFFISLICDQSIDPKQPNYGILPLPNLETKIVAANTLLGLQRGQLLLGSDTVRKLERELQQVRHDYFTARRYKDKKALRARDKQLCDQLAAALTDSGECSPYDAQRLAAWNPYDTNKAAPFFDPAWMFGLTGGRARPPGAPSDATDGRPGGPSLPEDARGAVFDIVVGNPPYVRQEELKNVTVTGSDGKPRPLKDALRDQYECYTGTADLYVYFFERSFQLLKLGGVLSFVTSNKYMRAAYGERLRAYLFYATHPRAILDFGDAPVFTSIAYPCILVAEKTRHVERLPDPQSPTGILHATNLPPADWQVRVHTWNPGKVLLDFPDLFDAEAHAIAQRDLKPDGWRLESPVSLRLLERMRKAGKPLGEYCGERFYRGVTTGRNEAFVVDRQTRDRLIAEHKSSAELLKPFLRGRDVKRWRCDSQDLWLIFTRRGCDIWKYPAIHEHLKQFKKQLIPGIPGGRKPGNYEWYEIQDNTAYWESFEIPGKVVFPDIAETTQFAWDIGKHFLGNTGYMVQAPEWVVPVLNSSTVLWFYRQTSNMIRGGYLRFISQYVEQIPIPSATVEQRGWCERLAEALIWLHSPGGRARPTETGLLVAYFERWLNGLVYELFFPGELRARRLALFDATAKLAPPDLAKIPEKQKLAALQELQAAADKSPLPAMLADLSKVEEVRIIEEAGQTRG